MRRRIGTLATCGVLMFSVGVPAATADAGPVDRGSKTAKCEKIYEKYLKALDKGQVKKADKLLKKFEKKGCFDVAPPT